MIEELCNIMHCDQNSLISEVQIVNRRFQDVEQPFSVLETEIFKAFAANIGFDEAVERIDPAFHVFNRIRRETLVLFPGVRETLTALHQNCKLIAHSDSNFYAASGRLDQLQVAGHFDRVYCREASASLHPRREAAARWASRFRREQYRELTRHQMKPNRDVLLEICARESVPPGEVMYVSDSLTRDILMASDAGVFSVWASYGAHKDPELYGKLLAISHWTKNDIELEREYSLRSDRIRPDFLCHYGLAEILPLFVSKQAGNTDERSIGLIGPADEGMSIPRL